MKRLLGIVLLLSAELSYAKGLEAEIQNYFNSLNMVSNVTGASAFKANARVITRRSYMHAPISNYNCEVLAKSGSRVWWY